MSFNTQPVYTDPPDAIELRKQMVTRQLVDKGITSIAVLEVMRMVPRHWFIPRASLADAYGDHPVAIAHGQTISQPYMVAKMGELVEASCGQLTEDSQGANLVRALEIGSGSGYFAAVLSFIVGKVVGVDCQGDLVEGARAVLKRLGIGNVLLVEGDGKAGVLAEAPYACIVGSCAVREVPAAWGEQLIPGGFLLFPRELNSGEQRLERWTWEGDGWAAKESIFAVRFVPLL